MGDAASDSDEAPPAKLKRSSENPSKKTKPAPAAAAAASAAPAASLGTDQDQAQAGASKKRRVEDDGAKPAKKQESAAAGAGAAAPSTKAKRPKDLDHSEDEDKLSKKKSKVEADFTYISKLKESYPRSIKAFENFLASTLSKHQSTRKFHLRDLEADEDLKGALRRENASLDDIINDATEVHAIVALKDPKDDKTVTGFRIKKPAEVEQAKTLGVDAHVLLNLVRDADRNGIWQGDLKKECSLETKQFDKALKVLETKNIIKRFKSILRGKKILFILSDLEPAREHTGKPWYTAAKTFDKPFVKNVSELVLGIMENYQYERDEDGSLIPLTVTRVHSILTSVVDDEPIKTLLVEDIAQVLESLRYARKVYRVENQALDSEYRVSREKLLFSVAAAALPCFNCPYEYQCAPRVSKYNPVSCEFLKELGM